MSTACEAALGQLGLIERNDLATMAIAKVIIGLAKEGERDAGRLCALALKRMSNAAPRGTRHRGAAPR
jgi:hypothetical protein